MLNYIKADNYCSLVNFKIDFSSINLLLGNNGTGKSTIFSLITILRAFILGKTDSSAAFGFQTLTRWQSVPVQAFEISLTYKGSVYIYQLEIEFDVKEKKNRVKKEIVLCDDNLLFKAENGKAILYDDSYKEGPEVLINWLSSGISSVYEHSDYKKLYDFKQAVEKIIVCHPLPFDFDFSLSFAEQKALDYSASNITNVYMYIVQRNPEKMMELWQVLKEINPCFVRTYLNGDNGKVLYFEYDHNGVKNSYSINEISDGERMLFILYFIVVMNFEDDYSLFLDEPDNFISLPEVGQFVQFIQDRATTKNQCVLISHHPSVIDFFAPSNGIWLERRSYGATTIATPPKSDSGLTYSEIISQGGMNEAE